jgi:hypothetical protein
VVRFPASPDRLVQGIAERVVALVVDALDLDALLATVDVDALLDRVDVERLLDRIDVQQVLDRVDVQQVLDRVDVQQLLDKVDVDALIARTDLAAAMADATRGTGGAALASLRRASRRADAAAVRLPDHLLGRT